MTSKRKHSSCSLQEKLEVLHRMDNGESASKLALEFRVGRATISDWKKNRNRLEQFCNSTSIECLEKRHTSKVSPYGKVDEALYIWFLEELKRGRTLSGPILKEKALHLNELLEGSENSFVASNGWLDRWKKRHGIRLLSLAQDQSADRAAIMNKISSTQLNQGYLPPGLDHYGENDPQCEEFPEQETCTPDFKLSQEHMNALNHIKKEEDNHNLTFEKSKSRPSKRHKNSDYSDENQPESNDILRDRYKIQLPGIPKKYSEQSNILQHPWESECVDNTDNSCDMPDRDVPDEILHLVKEIPPECDEEEQDASEWVTTHFPNDLETPEGPVTSGADEGNQNVKCEDDSLTPVSHIDAARALEIALQYVQEHAEATPTDVMFMERWRNIAASSLLSALRRKRYDIN